MPVVLRFPSREERIKAVEVLGEEDRSYSIVGGDFFVTKGSARLLKKKKVNFRMIFPGSRRGNGKKTT